MAKEEELEEKRQANTNFLAAFDYVMERLDISQKELCRLIGSKSPYISFYRSGKYPVPDKTKYALVDFAVRKNIGHISIDYLDGYTDIMLLDNIPDDELAEIKLRRNNPDYDKLKARREAKQKETESMLNVPYGQPTPSSMFNANLAQQAESVEAFRIALASKNETIKEKEERILELKETIAGKDARIENLKELVAQLRADLNDAKAIIEMAESGIKKYPFKIGAAEDVKSKKAQL
jgi:transcriptional regulator with XRE-family HTH domain